MHFVKFHPEVASCLLSRGKRKYVPLGMRLLWKYIRNYFLVYQLMSHFLSYIQNYKEFEAEILDLQLEKYGLSFDTKKCTTSSWALGDENVIGIRSFNLLPNFMTIFGKRKRKQLTLVDFAPCLLPKGWYPLETCWGLTLVILRVFHKHIFLRGVAPPDYQYWRSYNPKFTTSV